MKKIAVVVPFLNEEENLQGFDGRIREIRARIPGYIVEFIFVDDGSIDKSLEVVTSLLDEGVKIISLSRNYGSHYAIFAALDLTDADFLTLMSADMQEPLELYQDFISCFERNDVDMVFAKREIRNTSRGNRMFSNIYNFMVRKLAFHDFPENGADIFMLNRNVIESLQLIDEKNTSIYGVLFTIGYKKGFVNYRQQPRERGTSKWTLKKKVRMFVDTFVSFSLFPLRIITFMGVFFCTVGLVYGLFVILNAIFGFVSVQGWATVVALLTFGFGMTFLMIGIISEYLWRMFDQIRPRPRYIIRQKMGFTDDKEDR